MRTVVQNNQNGMVTISMSNRRWQNMLKYEQTCKLARTILRAKAECEDKPSMSINDAMAYIDTL